MDTRQMRMIIDAVEAELEGQDSFDVIPALAQVIKRRLRGLELVPRGKSLRAVEDILYDD